MLANPLKISKEFILVAKGCGKCMFRDIDTTPSPVEQRHPVYSTPAAQFSSSGTSSLLACSAITASQPPMCLPLMKTLGTVRWPVSSSSSAWMAAPSSLVSSSTTSNLASSTSSVPLTRAQYGQWVLENTSTFSWAMASCGRRFSDSAAANWIRASGAAHAP
ncbi:unnamed protein product [Phytophthora fragariaefolia]|uniref:Unnamed protein product n=1 Tax=Phytophthora fragariaefolia TaxID=1490495 RepID=A0A9W6U5N8_9STRA|nr:unnamed protein product [Phytophthora fragariaefolia]